MFVRRIASKTSSRLFAFRSSKFRLASNSPKSPETLSSIYAIALSVFVTTYCRICCHASVPDKSMLSNITFVKSFLFFKPRFAIPCPLRLFTFFASSLAS
jgi:hypothetical protein